LYRSGRDHIWGFVMRNLVRPIWLAQGSQKVDSLVKTPIFADPVLFKVRWT
jgi:hypothetical protein